MAVEFEERRFEIDSKGQRLPGVDGEREEDDEREKPARLSSSGRKRKREECRNIVENHFEKFHRSKKVQAPSRAATAAPSRLLAC